MRACSRSLSSLSTNSLCCSICCCVTTSSVRSSLKSPSSRSKSRWPCASWRSSNVRPPRLPSSCASCSSAFRREICAASCRASAAFCSVSNRRSASTSWSRDNSVSIFRNFRLVSSANTSPAPTSSPSCTRIFSICSPGKAPKFKMPPAGSSRPCANTVDRRSSLTAADCVFELPSAVPSSG